MDTKPDSYEGKHDDDDEILPEQLGSEAKVEEEKEAEPNDRDIDIDSLVRVTNEEMRQALKQGAKKKQSVEIFGVTIEDPKTALKKYDQAIKLVKKKLPIDLNDIFFTKFEGDKVGLSASPGIFLDVLTLMHPASRMAQVLSHERLHKKNTVPSEALVLATGRELGFLDEGGFVLTEKYNDAMEGFYDFIGRIGSPRRKKRTVLKIYDLYSKGKFEDIHKIYEKKYLKKLKTEEERREGDYFFFNIVFPELERMW